MPDDEFCVCGHAAIVHDGHSGQCGACECASFSHGLTEDDAQEAPEDEADDAGDAPADGDSPTTTDEPPAGEPPAVPVEYTVIAELERGEDGARRMIKFAGFQEALSSSLVPSNSRIWVSRPAFLSNAEPDEYSDILPTDDATLASLSDDRQEAMMTQKSAIFDRLLEQAWTPEQAASHLGVRAQKEGRMPRQKKEKAPAANGDAGTASKRTYSKLNPKTKIKKLADKNPAREGTATFERFALIKNGMTVEKYVEAGGKATYLTYFQKAGHIDLEAPAS